MNSKPVTHLKWIFLQNSLEFKVINNCHKKLHIKIYYEVLDLPWLIFQIYISKCLFISPNIFKNELNVNSEHKFLFNI